MQRIDPEANIDFVIWMAHLAGISTFRIAKHLCLAGCDEDDIYRYVEAKIRQFEFEAARLTAH